MIGAVDIVLATYATTHPLDRTKLNCRSISALAMSRISITQPSYFVAPAIFSLFIPLWFLKVMPLDGIRISQLGFPLAMLSLIAFCIWIEVVRGRRTAVVDGENGRVLIQTVSLLLRQKTTTFALSEFGSVRSYITPGRGSKNVVELVTVAGGEALLLAWFYPGVDKRKLFFPGETESIKAKNLRTDISKVAGLRDDGFLSVRWVGKQI
jgi:hypothetical protein